VKWILSILGIKTGIEKKEQELGRLREKAFQAQRNGDLRLSGKYLLEAEKLETEILNEKNE
tara:strand:+ start:495 stop:677 length:183 start_codon:yes stop_codon:yes gene_type:complete